MDSLAAAAAAVSAEAVVIPGHQRAAQHTGEGFCRAVCGARVAGMMHHSNRHILKEQHLHQLHVTVHPAGAV